MPVSLVLCIMFWIQTKVRSNSPNLVLKVTNLNPAYHSGQLFTQREETERDDFSSYLKTNI